MDKVSRTNVRGIYAAGDVTGVLPLASVAAMQGRLAMAHALGDAVKPLSLRGVSANIFTSPEIATVGSSEARLQEQGVKYSVSMLPLARNPRAKMLGVRDGFIKIFAHAGTGTVLGGVVVGPRASESIYPLTLAVTHRLTTDQLAETRRCTRRCPARSPRSPASSTTASTTDPQRSAGWGSRSGTRPERSGGAGGPRERRLMRYPAPLRPGDVIGVTSPSSGVPDNLRPRLDFCVADLRRCGFEVEVGQCMDGTGPTSAPAAERAAELTAMLIDPRIRAVVPPWGGELAIDLLPLLDFAAIGDAEPTWLVGYSDTSTLLLPLTLLTGVATLHGPGLMDTPFRVPVAAAALAGRRDGPCRRDPDAGVGEPLSGAVAGLRSRIRR